MFDNDQNCRILYGILWGADVKMKKEEQWVVEVLLDEITQNEEIRMSCAKDGDDHTQIQNYRTLIDRLRRCWRSIKVGRRHNNALTNARQRFIRTERVWCF